MYVKLGDGDSEWSASPQQVIPIYPFEPAKALPSSSDKTPSSSDRAPPEPSKHDGARGAAGGARGDGGDSGGAGGARGDAGDDDDDHNYVDARKNKSTTDGKQVSNISAAAAAEEGGEEEAPSKTPPPLTELPVPTQESVGVDRDSLMGTTLSNPDTSESTSRGSTSPNSSVHRNRDLDRPESQAPVSASVVAASAPPPDDDQQAKGRGTSRVIETAHPGEGSVEKSIPRLDADEPPNGGGGLGGVTRAGKKPVGGSTVLSPSALGTLRNTSAAGGISFSLNPKSLPDAVAAATPPPYTATGSADAPSCGAVDLSPSWGSAPVPAHPGLKPIAGGSTGRSAPVSAAVARDAVSDSVSADTARTGASDSATGVLPKTSLQRKPAPEGLVETKLGGVPLPGETGGRQAEKEHREEFPQTPSSEGTPAPVDAATTAAIYISPTREDETSNPNLVSFGVAGVVGTPNASEDRQRAGGGDTTITAGEGGTTRGVAPAAESHAGRDETPQQPAKTADGVDTVQGGAISRRGDDRRGPEKPEAAQGGTHDSRSVKPPSAETALQPDGDSVEPLPNTAGLFLKEKVPESGPVNHETSSSPSPQPGSGGCKGETRWDTLRLSVQRR